MELTNPLEVTADLKAEASVGGCYGARVENINDFMPDSSDEFFFCGNKENPVAREGGAIFCNQAVEVSFNIACGTGALLTIVAEEGTTGPQVQIEQSSLVGFSLVSDRAIGSTPASDVDCFVQNNVATCEAGWTYIHIWPNDSQCSYDPSEDCDISCGTSNGFSRIGCCASQIQCDEEEEVTGESPAPAQFNNNEDLNPEGDGSGGGDDQNDATTLVGEDCTNCEKEIPAPAPVNNNEDVDPKGDGYVGGDDQNDAATSVGEDCTDCEKEEGDIADMQATAEDKENTSGNTNEDDGTSVKVDNEATLVSEACMDLSSIEAHMKASLEELLQSQLASNYDCKCSEPDDVTLQIDCSVIYNMDGSAFANFERAVLKTISPSSTKLVPASVSWGDTAFNPIGVFQETFTYDAGGGVLKGCSANGCAACKICPDGASYEVDCGALSGDLAFRQTCSENEKATTFLASFYRDNPVQLEKDKIPSTGFRVGRFVLVAVVIALSSSFLAL